MASAIILLVFAIVNLSLWWIKGKESSPIFFSTAIFFLSDPQWPVVGAPNAERQSSPSRLRRSVALAADSALDFVQ